MWQVYCDDCGHLVLVGCRAITGLVNLGPGVIAVELECPAGHAIRILSGRATQDRSWRPPS